MHTLSPFPILCIPSCMSQSSLIRSVLTTLDSRGPESVRTPGQGYIHLFSFTRELCLGSEGIWNVLVCFSPSQRGQDMYQNSSTKINLQIPNYTAPPLYYSPCPQVLIPYSSFTPSLMGEVCRTLSNVNFMTQIDSPECLKWG